MTTFLKSSHVDRIFQWSPLGVERSRDYSSGNWSGSQFRSAVMPQGRPDVHLLCTLVKLYLFCYQFNSVTPSIQTLINNTLSFCVARAQTMRRGFCLLFFAQSRPRERVCEPKIEKLVFHTGQLSNSPIYSRNKPTG